MSSQDTAQYVSAVSCCQACTAQMVCLSLYRCRVKCWCVLQNTHHNIATFYQLETLAAIRAWKKKILLNLLKLIQTIYVIPSDNTRDTHWLKESRLAFFQVWEPSSDKQQQWLHLHPYPEWCPRAKSYWVSQFERSHLSSLLLCEKSNTKRSRTC